MAGEFMYAARPFVERNIHPTVIVAAYSRALTECNKII
jgi:T-complex protein 1 subunit gamma